MNITVPHPRGGAHTLVVAFEVDNDWLEDPTRDPELLDHARRLVAAAIARHRRGPDAPSQEVLAIAAMVQIADEHRLNVEQLTGRAQTRHVTVARQEAMWLIYRYVGLSYPETGELFGRHHSTVMHAVRQIDQQVEEDRDLGVWLERCWRRAVMGPADSEARAS